MFNDDAKIIQQLKPRLQRVLIADPHAASASMIAGQMRQLTGADVWPADTAQEALKVAAEVNPDLIFVELCDGGMDGAAFARALRRSDLSCRKAAVIAVTAKADPCAILAARDAGVSEFLKKPFTQKDLLRRLEAIALRSRGWVEAVDYVGPDRRAFNSGDYKGPLKRHSDVDGAASVGEALKILRSAAEAAEREPGQALRAMLAQTTELRAVGGVADARLAAALNELHGYLAETARVSGPLDVAEARSRAATVLAFAPVDLRAA